MHVLLPFSQLPIVRIAERTRPVVAVPAADANKASALLTRSQHTPLPVAPVVRPCDLRGILRFRANRYFADKTAGHRRAVFAARAVVAAAAADARVVAD